MTGAPERPESGPVRPPVALAFALIGFVALAIFGLGMTSLALDADVIAVPGLGQVPGVIGMLSAAAAFALALWVGLRAPHPSFWTAPIAALAAALAEAFGVLVGAVATGADLAAAVAAAGGVAVGWVGVVIAGAALVAAWSGVALVRTRSSRPRWPWERDDPEE
jgi:hypothetical protein